jgi:hypothetical protein
MYENHNLPHRRFFGYCSPWFFQFILFYRFFGYFAFFFFLSSKFSYNCKQKTNKIFRLVTICWNSFCFFIWKCLRGSVLLVLFTQIDEKNKSKELKINTVENGATTNAKLIYRDRNTHRHTLTHAQSILEANTIQ